MRMMHWTYQELMDTPLWVTDCLGILLSEENALREEQMEELRNK
nr:MAG TPA: hypothetical protein [Caudoviricetes sp.]